MRRIDRSLWNSERTTRQCDAECSCGFGVPYLDDSIAQILPTDLAVIAASTGAGKTELATTVAKHNSLKGRRVFFIALEAAKGEIHQRLKWPFVLEHMLQNRSMFPPHTHFNFRDWMLGKYEGQTAVFQEKLGAELEDKFRNLEIYYPSMQEFMREDLEALWGDLADEKDLIILDHLHYLDHEETQETLGVKRNVAMVRELVNRHRLPCVMISHLRKADRFSKSITPRIWELHGSSEISKQCTHAIGFASTRSIPSPKKDKPSVEYDKTKTVIEVLKSRWSEGAGYLGVCSFDWQSRQYGSAYNLFKISDRNGETATAVDYYDKPHWADRMLGVKD